MMSAHVLLLVLLLTSPPLPSAAHVSHHQPSSGGQAESVEDGATNPKHTYHYDKERKHNVHFDHEAIIGSQKDIEDFENLTVEQAKKKLMEIIGKMDANSDEVIERQELTEWIKKSYRSLSKEDSDDKFDDADDNDDGSVTWEEHLAESFGIDGEGDMPNPDDEDYADTKMWMEEDRVLFSLADQDGSGSLNREEYFSLAFPEEHEHMRGAVLANTLKEKDRDGDGVISLEEFLGEKRPHHDKEWVVSETDRFSNDFDLDKSGKLEGVEIQKWLQPDNTLLSEEEADHLIQEADDDKDGKLTHDEILNHWQTFVTSSREDEEDDDDDDDVDRDEL